MFKNTIFSIFRPKLRYNEQVIYDSMSCKVEIDGVDEVVNRTVQKGGRITGLTDWEGKKVKVLIIHEPDKEIRQTKGKKLIDAKNGGGI